MSPQKTSTQASPTQKTTKAKAVTTTSSKTKTLPTLKATAKDKSSPTPESTKPQIASTSPKATTKPSVSSKIMPPIQPLTDTQWLRQAQAFCIDMGFRKFKQREYLARALTHGSYTHENQLSTESNYERLEFFGDAVLKLVVSRYLFEHYTGYDEGQLTQIRAIVVSDKILAEAAKVIKLGEVMRFGPSEAKHGGAIKSSNLACGFEALLGALYLDGQQKVLGVWLIEQLLPFIESVDSHDTKHNSKAALQEWSQSKGWGIPEYRVDKETGPAHERIFSVSVRVNGKRMGLGKGKSKKEAQQLAAHKALEKIDSHK